jgi:sigma-E factor negative regulatory protein RseA
MRGQHSGGEAALGTTTEPQREMASALVDGEASEFETRRLLEALGEPEVRALVARHYTVRTLLRRDAPELCPPELTASIFAALDAETSLQGAVPASRWRRWAGGTAVAASVCLVTVLGVRGVSGPGADAPGHSLASAGVSMGNLGMPAAAPVLARSGAIPVGLGVVPASADRNADRAAELRLQMFMLDHAQNASLNTPQGMIPFVRVDSREQP